MPSALSRHVRSILPRRDPASRALKWTCLWVIVACGDRDGAKLAKDAEARWCRAIDAWRHRSQRRPGEHAARAGQWLAAETAAGHTSGTGSGGSPRSIISMMFLRLARADESGIAEPSRMRHVCENLHRAGLTGINRNDSVGPGPTLLEQCPPQRAQPCPLVVPSKGCP